MFSFTVLNKFHVSLNRFDPVWTGSWTFNSLTNWKYKNFVKKWNGIIRGRFRKIETTLKKNVFLSSFWWHQCRHENLLSPKSLDPIFNLEKFWFQLTNSLWINIHRYFMFNEYSRERISNKTIFRHRWTGRNGRINFDFWSKNLAPMTSLDVNLVGMSYDFDLNFRIIQIFWALLSQFRLVLDILFERLWDLGDGILNLNMVISVFVNSEKLNLTEPEYVIGCQF